MIATLKLCLHPTKEQEQKFFLFAGTTRFVYNWALAQCREAYDKLCSMPTVKQLYADLKGLGNNTEYMWLCKTPSDARIQALRDLQVAYSNFFNRKDGRPPVFKKKGVTVPSFYVRPDILWAGNATIKLLKIGIVRVKNCDWFPEHPLNPRIKFDGKHWYLTASYKLDEDKQELTDVSLGIDLGIKHLAVCSDGTVYENVNKVRHVKQLEKRLKKLQRKVSRKYELNKEGKKFKKTQNIVKLERQIKLVYRTLKNIRDTYIHTVTHDIVKTKPYRIVIEDLNVCGMMKNKHLSKAISEQEFAKFQRYLVYKAQYWGIDVIKADRFYPSSRTCSACGCIKQDLKLSDRAFICPDCGTVLDRDLNAAINLSNYGLNIA